MSHWSARECAQNHSGYSLLGDSSSVNLLYFEHVYARRFRERSLSYTRFRNPMVSGVLVSVLITTIFPSTRGGAQHVSGVWKLVSFHRS